MHIKNSQQKFSEDSVWRTYGLQIYTDKTSREFDPTFHMTTGRIAIISALLVFIGCYALGIAVFGFLIGIILGWLPAALVAWLAIRSITYLSDRRSRH
ncbi:MAG: hypothetical protein V4632_17715 [Pseudomonadota bacterium]